MFGTRPLDMNSQEKRSPKGRKGAPVSREFDDVYFSIDDGLAESEYVFLDGNGLPRGWRNRDYYTIAETGFGTGLNFLVAWKRFEETATPHQKLHFISIEKFPLDAEEIELHLQPWKEVFEGYLKKLLAVYPFVTPGFHRVMINRRVMLTLVFDDVNVALPQISADVDAWFLDGFKPSTNPEMWTDEVFKNVARLSKPGTRFSTFTAAGAVRRGLNDVGFAVEKTKGYGRKRDMTIGVYNPELVLGEPA
ncbi:MAG: tRNA (5-methylaminomethyl-2-thiouridine)(34)-methyltransferase MnmD [Alphaproteobacteria bacterium]|nr:tRNA (5-methylaminomethyl-2-thiouridine)(34)-methyltransferase MnmD [Alphaproteobacteria bacterium]